MPWFMGVFNTLKVMLAGLWASMTDKRDEFKAHMAGAISVQSAITIAGLIVTAVVALNVLAALAPTWFASTKDLSENFSTADVGDATANSIANDVFPLIIALLGVFAIAGLAFLVFKLRGKGGS